MSELFAESKLKRFLLYGSEEMVYYPGNRVQHGHYLGENLASLRKLLNQVQREKIFELVKNVQNGKLAAHVAIVPLVVSECCKISGWKEDALDFALTVLRSDKEFLLFCKFSYEILPDIGTGPVVTRFIQNWYESRHYWDLVEIVSERPSCYGWCHQDVINRWNVKFSCPMRAAVIAYVMGGVELMNDLFANDGEAQEIVDHLNRVEEFKKETDPDKAVIEIGAYMHTINTTNKILLEHKQVWKALIVQMDLFELLARLPTIRKNGFLRCPVLYSWDPHFVPHLCDRLGSLGAVLQSKISPSRSCIEHQRWKSHSEKFYYKSNKPKQINQDVLSALQDQMEKAMKKNVGKCKKEILVMIDCHNLPSSRCSPEQFVQADIAAAVAGLHLARSSTQFRIVLFKGNTLEYVAPSTTIEALKINIASDTADVRSTPVINYYLSPTNTETVDCDFFVVIGENVHYADYIKTIEDHRQNNPRKPKFAFCSLGGIHINRPMTYDEDLILASGFDDKMCHILTAFLSI